MAQQLREPPVGGPHRRLYADSAEVDPQWQGIDEHAQCAVGALATLHPAHQHGAEHHLLATRDLAQHLGPGQVHQAGAADPEAAGLLAQAPAQRRVQVLAQLDDMATIAADFLQAKGQGRFLDIAEHVAEKRFVFLVTSPQADLGDIVAILHGGRQLPAVAGQADAHFMHQHLEGGMVQQDMVE